MSSLAAAGYAPTAVPLASPLAVAPSSFEAAIVIDALEGFEWDRWLLQQVRRALVPNALLVLVARNLWSLASPAAATALAARIARRAFPWAAAPDPNPRRPFRGRGYRGRSLCLLLERLGFEIESCAGGGISAEWRVLARARDRGVLGGLVPLESCDRHVQAFEREQRDFVEVRENWIRTHPHHAPTRIEVFDPGAYSGATALVLAPHPDDEIIGCGGTILRLVRAGCRVVCVQATDGSDGWALRDLPEGERRELRIAEARAVAQAAGIAETAFWREDNRTFHASAAAASRLAELLKRLEPRLVFTPFLMDAHRDHRTLNVIVADAIAMAAEVLDHSRVLGYEVWGLAAASVVCEVTQEREEQEALLRLYESAMRVDDFIDLCERRNYYNACRLLGRPGYAEAFHACAAAEFPALVRESEGS